MTDKKTDTTEPVEVTEIPIEAPAENIVTPTTGYQHDTGAFRA